MMNILTYLIERELDVSVHLVASDGCTVDGARLREAGEPDVRLRI